jgi:hypothetical protein
MIAQSLLDFILSLLRDPEFQQEFHDDPGGTLERHGFQNLCGQDVADVMPLVIDNSRVSLDRSYEVGNNHVMVVPPPPSPHPMPGEPGLHAVVKQFDYITNMYTYNDSHNTVLDNSVNQNIWAHGDVFQLFDNDPVIASGDGAVAAGDDVEKVNTGDNNANSFGSGDAYHVDDLEADDGGAVSVGGNATGSNDNNSTDADIRNFGSGEVNVAGTNGNATQNDTDSHANSHNDVDTDVNSNNDINSHNDVDTDVNSNNHVDTDINSHNDVDTDVNSNNDIDTDVNSNNDIASHNDVDTDVNSHNDVDTDVNSNNDIITHTDVASHNLVIAP